MNERKKAKDYYELKDYENALTLYDKIWKLSNKDDHQLFAEYGNTLRKCNKSDIFIKEFSNLNKDSYLRKNNYVISVLCWCVYDVYIKNYEDSEDSNFEEFIKMAEFITKYTEQKESSKEVFTPFVLTVKKVVKTFNEKPSSRTSRNNQEKIIEWLEKLNPTLLSEECFIAKVDDSEYEQASSREFYYQNMTKAYERIEEYDKCISIGENALKIINKFHYKNKVWITGRILFSKCIISNNRELDLQNFKAFAEKENYWFFWYKLAKICYSFGLFEQSLFYNCKAIYSEQINENMVTLLYNLGLCWESQANQENSQIYYQACAYFRKLMGWNMSEELQYFISLYNIDIEQKPNFYKLKCIAKNYIDKNDKEYLYGIIDNILKNGFSGFIKPDIGEENIYFNMRNVIGNKNILKKNIKVRFKIMINDRNQKEAICVEGVR